MGYGEIRKVSCVYYVWNIHDFINVIQEGYSLYSPNFSLHGKSRYLNLRKHKNKSDVWIQFRLERSVPGDHDLCSLPYVLCILGEGDKFYWTSPVLTECSSAEVSEHGTHHELLNYELQRNIRKIAPEGVLSLHLIYPGKRGFPIPRQNAGSVKPAGYLSSSAPPAIKGENFSHFVCNLSCSLNADCVHSLTAQRHCKSRSGRKSTATMGEEKMGSKLGYNQACSSNINEAGPVKGIRSMSSSGTAGMESQTCDNLEDVDSPKSERSKSWAGIRTEEAERCTNLLCNQYCTSDDNDTDSCKAERFKSDSGTVSVGTQTCSLLEEVNSVYIGPRSKTTLDTATIGTQTCGVHSAAIETQTCTDLLCKEDCSSIAGLEKLSQNFKDFLMYDQEFDTVLNVKGRKFRAHKTLLKARAPKFAASLEEEMEKMKNDVVYIDDCEPGAFFHFQHYLYSGKCEKISGSNVVDLHYIAHKYCVEELSAACVQFMIRNLTIDTFCDFFTVGLRHRKLELIESVKMFFKNNMKQISATEKWKIFFRDNFDEAFELQQDVVNEVL